uniref:SAM-dependent MTase RsmB/NOP-type domain-containing protein n=1 Tax=Trypanosoma vivax (strain Y486) TaxID=1055687 RepID=G0TVK7_TRYVY|nr:conserved hypothetical protein, fragment [Trypanosoma vivax Y486]
MEIVLEEQRERRVMLEPTWVKNALAACSSAEELSAMKSLLDKGQRGPNAPGCMTSQLVEDVHGEHDALAPALTGTESTGSNASLEAGIVPGYSNAALASLCQRREYAVSAPNASFSRYFIRQGLVAEETELMELFRAMSGRQPTAFRVHTSEMHGRAAAEILSDREGIEPLKWLPSACGAFVMQDSQDVPHSMLLSNRQLLRSLANEKLISFQSTSSMLPVLLLDPKPGESVLDLCASPGSKTSLIVDYMSAPIDEESPGRSKAAQRRYGCVLANDISPSRSRTLAQRLQNVCPSVAVTQLQGLFFQNKPVIDGGVRYDKILVDVPCSGEGRMRRDAMSWRMWHPLRAAEFVPSQLQLLRQAIDLCAPGGTVVYSTCTLNPIENEAVVAAVLRDGASELVKPPRTLREKSGWKFSQGLRHWLVPSHSGGFFRTLQEAEAKEGATITVPKELFWHEECEGIYAALESCCLRVMPHLNGGAEGFFMAAFRKLSVAKTQRPLPSEPGSRGVNPVKNTKAEGSEKKGSVYCGSIVNETLLHARGVVRLTAQNTLVQRSLGGFFCNSVPQLEMFLSKHQLCAAWRESQGLLLVSESAWSHLGAISPPSQHGGLLDLGITVVDAATGHLTEAGAFHLRPHATSRVLHLPLPELQWLLSSHVIKVQELQEDPTLKARCAIAGLDVASNGHNALKQHGPPLWAAEVMKTIGESDGNFIVCCTASSVEGIYVQERGGKVSSTAGLLSICIPVVVRRTPGIELHICLSHDATQRCLAVIGRVIGHAKRMNKFGAQRGRLQLGGQFNVSSVMAKNDLEGRRPTIQQQQRQLLVSQPAVSPPHLGRSKNSSTCSPLVGQEVDEGRNYFVI